MYEDLEYEYKDKSNTRWYRLGIMLIILFVFFLFLLLTNKFPVLLENNIILLSISIAILLVMILIHFTQYIFLLSKGKLNKKNWNIIFSFSKCLDLFFDTSFDLNIGFLFDYLMDNGIDNMDKLKIAIEHYNSLIEEEYFSIKGSFLSIIAIFVSIFTYISNDGIHYSEYKLQYLFSFIFIIASIYFIIWTIYKIHYKFFSKKEMYKKIEEELSDIYFHYDEYKEKYIQKIAIICLGGLEKEYKEKIKYKNYEIVFIDTKQLNSSNYKFKYILFLRQMKNNNFNIFLNPYNRVVFIDDELKNKKNIRLKEKIDNKSIKLLFNNTVKYNDRTLLIEVPKCNDNNVDILNRIINNIKMEEN